eukprot:TRINITY_DN11927_c0_g3_i11.p2 TRINITY_DN11927_c0_g3~~TRINITY_DN11927_c0_g3_i11.p2  ORF type:complete len:259 (+),score=24.54 TRINITY_DN11927_c0_g3_i11:1-777(+)
MMAALLLLDLLCRLTAAFAVNILDFGAVPNDSSNSAALANANALANAFQNASTLRGSHRRVSVPAQDFYAFATPAVWNLTSITLEIHGRWIASNNITAWPLNRKNECMPILEFDYCQNLTFQGSGYVIGQGYDWWVLTILNAIHSRPHMLVMNQCQHVVIKDLHFYDSPQFHLRLHDIVDFRIHGIEIKVDVEKQRALLAAHDRLTRNHSQLPDGIPTFPLNTDGIDPADRDDCNETARTCTPKTQCVLLRRRAHWLI